MKLLERVQDSYIHGMVPRKGTTDAIFVVRRLEEEYIAANKLFYFASVNLRNAFGRLPKNILWSALRSLWVG